MTQRNVPKDLKARHVNNWQLNYYQVCLSSETIIIDVLYNHLTVCGATNRHTEFALGSIRLEIRFNIHPVQCRQ